jgi:hypothetical protein|tara:strand:- start:8400 stop:9257 length:858 start_codon:yes stop_codon:yes gene_type:complete
MSGRNNLDRLGASNGDPDANTEAAPTQQQTQMQFVSPTEIVDLPSRGEFYPEDHPLHNKETVEIRYMTARDEDILVNKSFIQKGVVLDKLLESVILDKNISIPSLLGGDKSAILIATRVTGYGSEYETKVACPSCGDVGDFSFDLNEASTITTPEDSGLEYDKTEYGTFLVKTPRTSATIELKPSTGHDEDKIAKTNKMRQKNGLPELGLTDIMMAYMVSVDGNSDRSHIISFVDSMPAMDARFVRLSHSKLMPSIDVAQQFKCNSCDHEQEMEVPFTSDFFWPK